jgi:hypothetical protein
MKAISCVAGKYTRQYSITLSRSLCENTSASISVHLCYLGQIVCKITWKKLNRNKNSATYPRAKATYKEC